MVDTATHRRAYQQRRLIFSWGSFYAGVGVALGMMLIAYKALPHESLTARSHDTQHASSRAGEGARGGYEQVPLTGALTASSLVLAIEATSPKASHRGASVALEHLRWRGAAPTNGLDREYAALAVMELMDKTRAEAESMVASWAAMADKGAPYPRVNS